MTRIKRGWALSKKSWTLLSENRSLIRFPIYGAVATIPLAIVFLGPGLYLLDQDSLGGAIPLFLVVFAVFYLSLSQASTTHFSEPLNHSSALYLVVTVFSTVGFGDITPKGDLARIAVSIQMLLDLVVIGAVVRLLTTAAKSGSER